MTEVVFIKNKTGHFKPPYFFPSNTKVVVVVNVLAALPYKCKEAGYNWAQNELKSIVTSPLIALEQNEANATVLFCYLYAQQPPSLFPFIVWKSGSQDFHQCSSCSTEESKSFKVWKNMKESKWQKFNSLNWFQSAIHTCWGLQDTKWYLSRECF